MHELRQPDTCGQRIGRAAPFHLDAELETLEAAPGCRPRGVFDDVVGQQPTQCLQGVRVAATEFRKHFEGR